VRAKLLQVGTILLLFAAATSTSAQVRYDSTTRSPHGTLNLPCQNCHTFTAWKPIRNITEFDHNQTKFPLRGLHANVACRQCHSNLVFSEVGTKCADCHADIHRRQFGAACEQCHTVRGWTVSLTSIKQHLNRFPLIGAHATLQCDDCHKSAAVGQFKGLSTDCTSCHLPQFQQAKGMPAVPQQYGYVAGSKIRSPSLHRICLNRSARQPRLQFVPCGRQIQRHSRRLHELPHQGFRYSEEPRSRKGRIPYQLFDMPRHQFLVERAFRPQHLYRLPSDRRPCQCSLLPMPREQSVRWASRSVLIVPHQGLSEDDKSESSGGGLSDRLLHLPQHGFVGQCEV